MVQGVPIVDGYIVNSNPATGDEINRIPCTTPAQLDDLVKTAATAQHEWSITPVEERIQLLQRGLTVLAEQRETLVSLIVQEMGKPVTEAQAEVDGAVNRDEYFQVLLEALQPKKRGKSCLVVRQALGVVGVLSPWNFPADEILLLVLPALASGNAVVVKPSEVTPSTGALVVDTLASVLPSGVLQLAQGDGRVGAQIVSHPLISMIAMTGSSATGQKILQVAAPQMKRLVLEMGGKDPMIVFDDVTDLDKAAHDAVAYSLGNAGQVCCSTERIYVAESIYSEFCGRVAKVAASYTVGNGMDPNVKVGPLVSPLQRDQVKEQVDDAMEKGAKLLFQSAVPEEKKGNFYPVTVLSDVQDPMKIYREETFGPVVSLTPFDGSEAQAIRLANDTEYGLASSVYTGDLVKAQRVASAIQAGQVGINCYAPEHMDVGCPWVGHKQSGYGYHSGPEGFHQFSVPKTLVFAAPIEESSTP
jgi:succinate-semialdehyde dehydrogenase/glutarate-semialdehyde dehydrogenase